MLVRNRGAERVINPYAFVAPTAVLVDQVSVGQRARVMYGAVLREAPVPVIPISYTLNAARAIFAPLVRGGKRGTALISSVLGNLMAFWSAIGMFFISDR